MSRHQNDPHAPGLPGARPPGLSPRWSPEQAARVVGAADAPDSYQVDVVIVGTGPGGCAVARQVVGEGRSVLLLEEGPARRNFRPSYSHVARFHMQEGGTMLAQGAAPFPIAAGRGVGGGALINSAICFRTPRAVLERWAEDLADSRFSPAEMARVYEEIEDRIHISDVNPGIAGENNMIVARGVERLGLMGGLLRRNTPGCVGCGICPLGCPTGGKASVDVNLLSDALDQGARVQADCRVDQVLTEGERVVGVAGWLTDPETRAQIRRIEIRAGLTVLSAGAIGTPRLLWQDGVAERMGPVGDQLFVHPGSGLMGRCAHEVHMWRGATQGAYVWSADHPHVLPHTFSAPPAVLLSQSGQIGMAAKRMLTELNHICGLGVMVSDRGHGRVRAGAGGRASIRYRWAEEDITALKDGMVLSAEVLLAGGAEEVFGTIHRASRHRTAGGLADEIADRPLSDFGLYAAHPMATCPMGTDPDSSVISPRGRSHRLDGLYLADASVFPSSLGVNPQLTTMVMATLVGRAIVEDEF